MDALSKPNLLTLMDIYHSELVRGQVVVDGVVANLQSLCRKAGTIESRKDLCDLLSVLNFWDYNRSKLEDDDDVLATLNTPTKVAIFCFRSKCSVGVFWECIP